MQQLKLREHAAPEAAAAVAFYEAFQRGQAPRVRLWSAHQARVVGETPTGPILRFILFSEGVKRDGSEVKVDGLDLTNLRANPRVMWVHRYDTLPVGNWVHFETAHHPALGRVLYADAAPLRTTDGTEHLEFARMLFTMYRNNDLSAVSGGWHPLEMETITDEDGYFTGFRFLRSDVLEGSMVPIPADPQALQVAIQRGVIPTRYVDRFVRATGDEPNVYVLREAAAIRLDEPAEPVALEVPAAVPQEPVNEPPASEELTYEVRFLPSDATDDQKRIGAVLSKKNRSAIEAAMAACQSAIVALEAVLEAANGPKAEDDMPMMETAAVTAPIVRDAETDAILAETTAGLSSRLAALTIAHEQAITSEFYASILGRVERLSAHPSRDRS